MEYYGVESLRKCVGQETLRSERPRGKRLRHAIEDPRKWRERIRLGLGRRPSASVSGSYSRRLLVAIARRTVSTTTSAANNAPASTATERRPLWRAIAKNSNAGAKTSDHQPTLPTSPTVVQTSPLAVPARRFSSQPKPRRTAPARPAITSKTLRAKKAAHRITGMRADADTVSP
jgi:hypothetical protein